MGISDFWLPLLYLAVILAMLEKESLLKTVSPWTPEWLQKALHYRDQSLLNLQKPDDGTVFTPVLRAN